MSDTVDAQLDKIMKTFDKDGDGVLTFDEVYSRIRQRKDVDPLLASISMFNHYNRDANVDTLTTQEIRDVLVSKKLADDIKKSQKGLKTKAKGFLKKYDTDKNGNVSWNEMLQIYLKDPDFIEEDDGSTTGEEREKIRTRRATNSCKYFFLAIDKNNDDKLTFQEIKNYLEKHPEFDLGPSQ